MGFPLVSLIRIRASIRVIRGNMPGVDVLAGHKKAGADAPAESAALATAYCIVSMLRDCFILEVTLRCSLAERWVYLRGRILPVSVI